MRPEVNDHYQNLWVYEQFFSRRVPNGFMTDSQMRISKSAHPLPEKGRPGVFREAPARECCETTSDFDNARMHPQTGHTGLFERPPGASPCPLSWHLSNNATCSRRLIGNFLKTVMLILLGLALCTCRGTGGGFAFPLRARQAYHYGHTESACWTAP